MHRNCRGQRSVIDIPFDFVGNQPIQLARTPAVQPVHDQFELFHVLTNLVCLHFAYANPERRRVHEVLAVAQSRHHRNVQAAQETRKHGVTLGALTRAIGNDGEITFAPVELRE